MTPRQQQFADHHRENERRNLAEEHYLVARLFGDSHEKALWHYRNVMDA